jgi:hypothetical protein
MYLNIASKEEEGVQNVAGVVAATVGQSPGEETPRSKARWVVMSTRASVLVDSVGPPSAEVCRAAASFP